MKKKEKERNRAKSVADVLSYKARTMEFEGAWLASFGTPELGGCWLIWGQSGNGKTRFGLLLCKYLTRFGRVAYDTLEEGLSLSFRNAVKQTGMEDAARRFVVLDREEVGTPLPRLLKPAPTTAGSTMLRIGRDGVCTGDCDFCKYARLCADSPNGRELLRRYRASLRARLSRPKSPDIIVIDSVQYSGLNKDTAKDLVDAFPKKLFVFISHAEGKNPSGRTATAIRYHAGVKAYVEGYRVFAVSRFSNGDCIPFTVWDEGAKKYWGYI